MGLIFGAENDVRTGVFLGLVLLLFKGSLVADFGLISLTDLGVVSYRFCSIFGVDNGGYGAENGWCWGLILFGVSWGFGGSFCCCLGLI